EDRLATWAPENQYPESWDIVSLAAYLNRTFGIAWTPAPEDVPKLDVNALKEDLLEDVHERYEKRPTEFEGFDFGELEKMVLLQMIDQAWKNHLYDLDHLKKSIGLRAYGQKDPLVEYQKESFLLFEAMLGRVREQTVEYLFRVEAPRRVAPPPPPRLITAAPKSKAPARDNGKESKDEGPKGLVEIKRNYPCYCGSGKKYKKCHGAA